MDGGQGLVHYHLMHARTTLPQGSQAVCRDTEVNGGRENAAFYGHATGVNVPAIG
jgi:hypothetical protein